MSRITNPTFTVDWSSVVFSDTSGVLVQPSCFFCDDFRHKSGAAIPRQFIHTPAPAGSHVDKIGQFGQGLTWGHGWSQAIRFSRTCLPADIDAFAKSDISRAPVLSGGNYKVFLRIQFTITLLDVNPIGVDVSCHVVLEVLERSPGCDGDTPRSHGRSPRRPPHPDIHQPFV